MEVTSEATLLSKRSELYRAVCQWMCEDCKHVLVMCQVNYIIHKQEGSQSSQALVEKKIALQSHEQALVLYFISYECCFYRFFTFKYWVVQVTLTESGFLIALEF